MRLIDDVLFNGPAPSGVQSAVAQVEGQPGMDQWWYWWIVNYPIGVVVTGPMFVAHVPTLSSLNYVVIGGQPAEGAESYDLIRTDSENFPQSPGNFLVVSGLPFPEWNDTGAPLTLFDPQGLPWGAPASVHLHLNNRDYLRPTLMIEFAEQDGFPGAGGPGVQLLVPELIFPDGTTQTTAGGGGGGGGQNQSPWQQNINGANYNLNNVGYLGVGQASSPSYRISVNGSINVTGSLYYNGVPVPAQGPQGPAGAAATIQVGTVTTLGPGSPATVTNVGTNTSAVFNFGIPQGQPGSGGGGGSQTPWLQDVDADRWNLLHVGQISVQYMAFCSSSYVAELYLDDNGSFQFVNGAGTGVLWITQNGRLGVGVQQPGYAVDVAGDINVTGGTYRVNGVPITAGGGFQSPWLQNIDAAGYQVYSLGQVWIGGPPNDTGLPSGGAATSGGAVLDLITDITHYNLVAQGSQTGAWAGCLFLGNFNADTVSIFVTPNNLVGLAGNTRPSYPVDILGDCNCTGTYRINGVPITAGGGNQTPWLSDICADGFNLDQCGTAQIEFLMLYSDTNTAAISLDAAGNIAFPNSVTVEGDIDITGSYLQNGTPISAGGGSQTPWTSNIDAASFGITHLASIGLTSSSLSFNNSSGTSIVTMTTTGNISIGGTGLNTGIGVNNKFLQLYTTTPANLPSILLLQNVISGANYPAGQIFFSSTSGGIAYSLVVIEGGTGPTNDSSYLRMFTRDGGTVAERMRINNVGNVGIGTATPAFKLDVAGNINSTGNTIGAFGWTVTGGILYCAGDPFGNYMVVNPNLGTIDIFGDVTFHGTVTGVDLAQLESRLSRLEGRMGV